MRSQPTDQAMQRLEKLTRSSGNLQNEPIPEQ